MKGRGMRLDTKHKLINLIRKKGRLLTFDEAFDFYTENIMRNSPSCKWNPWKNQGRGKWEDYTMDELKQKAGFWHRHAVGALAMEGWLEIQITRKEVL